MFNSSPSPPRSTAPGRDHVLDLAHLSRMTMGDESLEREVLQLFDRQAEIILARMASAAPPAAAALAHTLKGSARGVGAWKMAQAAEIVEQSTGGSASLHAAIAMLSAATEEVRADVAKILRNRHRDAA